MESVTQERRSLEDLFHRVGWAIEVRNASELRILSEKITKVFAGKSIW